MGPFDQQDGIPTVTASAVGQCAYCPYSHYLAEKGVKRTAVSQVRLKRGTAAHKRWAAERRGPRAPVITPWKMLAALLVFGGLAMAITLVIFVALQVG